MLLVDANYSSVRIKDALDAVDTMISIYERTSLFENALYLAEGESAFDPYKSSVTALGQYKSTNSAEYDNSVLEKQLQIEKEKRKVQINYNSI